ncbi:hypothetical protein [Faecalimicrobium sp. JNUCC 81]
MRYINKLIIYLVVYILFVALYSLNFKGDISFINMKLCLLSSIIPALVGGTATNLLFK